jgi:DNA-binding NtrC family response regulator
MAMLVHSGLTDSGSPAPGRKTGVRDFSPMLKKSPNVNVLIVDDESLILWSLAETLTDHGYGVLQAGDGQGAVKALQDTPWPVDVIMLDYRLPDSNGLQLLGKIRAMSPQSRVVLMTAYGTPEVVSEALRLGVFCVVSKPLEMQEVADLVSRAYGSSPA